MVQAEVPQVAARAAAVVAAEQSFETVAATIVDRSAKHSEAVAAEQRSRSQAVAADEALLHCELELQTRRKACDIAKAAVDDFRTWPLECFRTLKARAKQQHS